MPIKTEGDRDALLKPFHDAGLVPVLSTNGGIPSADVQVVRVPATERVKGEPSVILDVATTDRGRARLERAVAERALEEARGVARERPPSPPRPGRAGSRT